MNFIDAIKTGLPLRRKGKSTWTTAVFSFGSWQTGGANTLGEGYLCPDYLLTSCRLSSEDVLATDWEVREKTVTITKRELREALGKAFAHNEREYQCLERELFK